MLTPAQEQSLESLNTSTRRISDYLLGKSTEVSPWTEMWVDARDLARAHVLALTTPAAGGQRFLTCGDKPFTGQQIVDVLRAQFPDYRDTVPVGQPGVTRTEGIHFLGDNSKIKKVLGIKFRSFEESVVGTSSLILLNAMLIPPQDTAKSVLELKATTVST